MATLRRTRRTTREQSRDAMLEQLERIGIHDRCVLAAMTYVPREPFVAAADALVAYAERPLSIGHGQTLASPSVIARMLQALQLLGGERVLEIGTGSGYTAAVLSQLAAYVDSVERDAVLASTARARLGALGYDGIEISCRDGSLGIPEHGPFDAILVAAAAPAVPPALVAQLAIGGRIVMAVGTRDAQVLRLVTKSSASMLVSKDLGPVVLSPLVGAQGFPAPDCLDSE